MRQISTAVVKFGKTQPIVGSGKFLRIFASRVSSGVFSAGVPLVQIDADGQTYFAVPGDEIEFKNPAKNATISCPGITSGVLDVEVTYYIGDFPFVAKEQTEPGQSMLTFDWVSLPVGASVNIPGTLTINGTTYRRTSAKLTNVNGLTGFQAAVSILKSLAVSGVAKTSFSVSGGANAGAGPGFEPILPAGGASGPTYPVIYDSDDMLSVVCDNAQPGTVDLSIVQTWVPLPIS